MQGKGSAVKIDLDEFRSFHPQFEKIQKTNDRTESDHTHIFAGRVSNDLRQEAINRQCNIVMDGTLRDAGNAQSLAQQFNNGGYIIGLSIMAVAQKDSQHGIYDRYENQKIDSGYGRWVPVLL